MANKLITPVFRGSFVHLAEPKAPAAGADPVYSMVVVLPKDDPETKAFMKNLKSEMEAAAVEKFGKRPRKLKMPVKDGDEEERDEWSGCWAIPVKNKNRPGVVDKRLQDVLDPDQLYSGAYYRASVSVWAWSHATGGQGVSVNLNNVQWVKDGESFANVSKPQDDFADFKDDDDDDTVTADADDEDEISFD